MSQRLIGIGASANDGTGDKPREVGVKLNANFAELYGLVSRLRPVLLADGDSKTHEFTQAVAWAVARSRFNVQYGQGVTGGGIGGTGSGSTQVSGANNLLWPARLAAMAADVQARVALGQIVDISLRVGTNDLSGAAGATLTPDQIMANVRKYQQSFHAAGGRILWLSAVDPRSAMPAVGGLNALYRLFAGATPGVEFVDTGPYLADPVDGKGMIGGQPGQNAATAFSASNGDGLHLGAYGVYLMSFAIEKAFARVYAARPLIGLDAEDYWTAAGSRGNILSKNYAAGNSGTTTGTARTIVGGGIDSVTLADGAAKSVNAPLGWTVAGALSGTLNLTVAPVTTCPHLEAHLGVPNQRGIAFTISGTPTTAGQLACTRIVTNPDGGTLLMEASALFEATNLSGGFGVRVTKSNIAAASIGSLADVACLGREPIAGEWDQLPTLNGLFNPTAILVPAASLNPGLGFIPLRWRAGVEISGTVIMLGMSLRTEFAIPAATV